MARWIELYPFVKVENPKRLQTIAQSVSCLLHLAFRKKYCSFSCTRKYHSSKTKVNRVFENGARLVLSCSRIWNHYTEMLTGLSAVVLSTLIIPKHSTFCNSFPLLVQTMVFWNCSHQIYKIAYKEWKSKKASRLQNSLAVCSPG